MTINHHGSTAIITQDKTSLIEFLKKLEKLLKGAMLVIGRCKAWPI